MYQSLLLILDSCFIIQEAYEYVKGEIAVKDQSELVEDGFNAHWH